MDVPLGFFFGRFVLTTKAASPRKVIPVAVDSSCGDCVISRMYTLDTERETPLSKSTILQGMQALSVTKTWNRVSIGYNDSFF